MIQVKMNHAMKMRAWDYLKENNIANRGTFDGSKKDQFVGLLGEMAVWDFLDLYPQKTWNTTGQWDGGVDLVSSYGLTFDIKTIRRTVDPKPHFEVNVLESQMSYDVESYIFCSVNERTSIVTICGFIFKNDFIRDAEYIAKGMERMRDNGTPLKYRASTYLMKISELIDIKYLYNLYHHDK